MVNIYDFVKKIKVFIATVSDVINYKEHLVSTVVKKRLLAAIEKLNYISKKAAINLVRVNKTILCIEIIKI
ncbi:MAG: LacI family DNA-binding transcriptional regulator [Actinobacteria bacterium]|nr:LacI family DNA-binding transcriptional regulator [Actinomycetota bacterium]